MSLFGFFNEYPYRDIENLNLDWLLKNYGKIVEDVASLKAWRVSHEGEYEALLAEVTRIANEIDTFEAQINARFADLDRSIHEDFDALTAEIRAELEETKTEIRAEFDAALAEFTRLYTALKNEVETDIANMRYEISRLTLELRTAIAELRTDLNEYIDERFDLFIQNLPDYEKLIIHNPVRGYDTTVQVAIDDLYNSFNVFGLTAREFDSLELTAEEFDNYGLTAHEFDSLGYNLLHYPDPRYYMQDPFTGLYVPVQTVIMELFNLHAQTMTAADFDALELTCDEFEAYDISAFDFDFFGIPA